MSLPIPSVDRIVAVVFVLTLITFGYMTSSYVNENYWQPNYANSCGTWTGSFLGQDCGLPVPAKIFISLVVGFIFSSLTASMVQGLIGQGSYVFLGSPTTRKEAARTFDVKYEGGATVSGQDKYNYGAPRMDMTLSTVFFLIFFAFFFAISYVFLGFLWANAVTVTYVTFIFLMLFVPMMKYLISSTLQPY